MLIENTTIINFEDLTVLEGKDVLIEGERIVKIGENLLREGEVIDGSNFYLIPGLVNLHSHTAMSLLRGIAEDVSIKDWFNKHIWIYEANLQEKDVYFGTLLGAYEMLLNGVTTVFDHYFYMDHAFEAYEEIGIRADLSWTLFGTGEGHEENFKKAMKFYEKYSGKSSRITLSLGPHSPYICPEEFLKEIAKLSAKENLKIHIHVSEEKWQVEKSLKEKGRTPIKYLYDLGIVKENTILAHAYFATNEELKIIKETNSFVAHCPKTYMRFGIINNFLPKALREKINVGIGTDGPASNSNLSVLESARDSALLGKLSEQNAEVVKVEEVLPLLTRGAKAIRKDLGEIKEGYIADLVLIKKNAPELQPENNIFANILYSLSEREVDTVMVNGRIVVKNGTLLTVDIKELLKEIKEISERLRKRVREKPIQIFGEE
ncbi:MAG: amidohydrolase [Dictyoglomaceae bacterium]